jgi:hypothetical protein
MRDQGNNTWGLTVSRRFESVEHADGAVERLRQSGFREDEIRVWQHKRRASPYEDRLARTFEGFLAGGVISAFAAFFVIIAFSWTGNEPIVMEFAAGAAVAGGIVGGLITAIAVNVISSWFSFSERHEVLADRPSIVTVTVGDREAEAKQVFDSPAS